MTEPRLPAMVGEVIAGKYRLDRVLGMGGMGVVIAATHLALHQKVAIKFLLPEARAVSGMFLRFANEARASAQLRSEHVARILDVGALEDGTPYMVMEYLEGRDLAEILTQRGRVSVAEACGYVLEACEALAEAHAKGIVHRDLKPGNLFIARTADGEEILKLLDFGISKHVAPEGADFSLTKTSAVLGSPLYMPPEQMSSARSVDARADIWSLGVVLYEAVTGTMPFEGLSLTALVATIIQDPPKPLTATGATIPLGFEEVVYRCLEKSPSHRFATVGELARALAPFAPRASSPSVDKISRLEAAGASMKPARPPAPAESAPVVPAVAPSDPPPMRLVRVRRVPTVSRASTTVAKERPPPVAAVTHAAQMLPSRRGRLTDRMKAEEDAPRGPVVLIALLLVTGVILGAILFMRSSHRGGVPSSPAAEIAATPSPPSPAPLAPAPPLPLDVVDAASPAPPATFAAESPSAPPPSALRSPPPRAPSAGMDRRKAPPGVEDASRPPAPSRPAPPAPAPHPNAIDMEPK